MMGVLAGRYPSPNDFSGDKGDLLNTAGYRFNAPIPYKENNFVGRVDLNPSPAITSLDVLPITTSTLWAPLLNSRRSATRSQPRHEPRVGRGLGLDDRHQQDEQR